MISEVVGALPYGNQMIEVTICRSRYGDGHNYPIAMLILDSISRPSVAINPLIIKGIDSLDAPDSVKLVLHDIVKIEHNNMVKGDRHSATTSIKRVLENCANNDEVVEFCDKHG